MHAIRYNQSITPLTVPFFSAFLIIFGLSRCFTHRCSSSRLLARACVRSPVQQFFGRCGAVRTRRARRWAGTGFISRLFCRKVFAFPRIIVYVLGLVHNPMCLLRKSPPISQKYNVKNRKFRFRGCAIYIKNKGVFPKNNHIYPKP